MIDKKLQGRRNRINGAAFEMKVRRAMEKQGWIVVKHQNNIDLDNKCFIPAKRNRFKSNSTGFPDFLGYMGSSALRNSQVYALMFVEAKTNNILDKTEKLKMNWLLEQGYKTWVAYKGTNGEVLWRKFEKYIPRK
jgi:hypothetical protein